MQLQIEDMAVMASGTKLKKSFEACKVKISSLYQKIGIRNWNQGIFNERQSKKKDKGGTF